MRRLAAALVLVTLLPALVGAVTTRPLSIGELTTVADTIVVGRVSGAEAETGAAGTIHTRVALDVEQVLKGRARAGAPITIVQPGGDVGGVTATVADAPTFEPGERVLVFLTRRPDGTLRVAHLFQGKFSVESNPTTRQPQAVRRAPDTHAVMDAVSLADALALVRASLPGGRGEDRRD